MSESRQLVYWVAACLIFGMAALALCFGDVDSFRSLRDMGLRFWGVGR